MITLEKYLMGRGPVSLELEDNATILLLKVNSLIGSIDFPVDRPIVASGYRTPAVNSATPNASKKSKHMKCQAIDLQDHDGSIDAWCDSNLERLTHLGLWREHPDATQGWCHLQSVPPSSGNNPFYP